MTGTSLRKMKTKQQILLEARKQFVDKGYRATLIEDVMAACGLTHGGFYSYFTSKHDLFSQAMAGQIDPLSSDAQIISQAASDSVDRERLMLKNIVDTELLEMQENTVPLHFFAKVEDSTETNLTYTQALHSTLAAMMKHLTVDSYRGEDELLTRIALIVGTEVMSRKIIDPYLRHKLNQACEKKLSVGVAEAIDDYLWEQIEEVA